MRKLNIESIKQKILESSVTRDNIFALLEAIEPLKPNSVKSVNKVVNSGTNIAKKQYYKEFNTSKGNNVKVFMNPGATSDELTVGMAVNGEYIANSSSDKDPEILKGSLFIVKKYVEEKKPNIVSMNFFDEDGKGSQRFRVFSKLVKQILPNYEEFYKFGHSSLMLKRVVKESEPVSQSPNNHQNLTESTEHNLPADEYYDLEDELLKNTSKTPEQIIQGWKNVDDNYYGIEEDFIKTHCCGIIHKIKFENKWYVLFDRDLYEIEEIIDNYERYSKKFPFIGEIEDRFNNDFWDSPKTLYHATDCENVKSILQNGLKSGYGTGLMNTGTFGIYTSLNPEGYIESYGDCVISIDCASMAQDGFKPFVNQEPDVVEYEIKNALSHLLDYEMEFDAQNDTDPDTVIVTAENIPAKYLKLVKGSLTESIEKPLEEVYSENNSALLRYVKDEDIDISEHPFDLLFHDWMYDHDEEALREFEDEHSWDDWQAIEARFPKEIKMFKEAVKNGKYNDDPDVVGKTKVQMSLQGKQLLPRTTWLVHFSKYADEIANEGFTSGAEDMTDMALTVFNRGTKRPGYNFAFIADSRYANRAAASPYGRRNGAGKYGEDAVMFMNSGVHFYHSGDEEDQIVFYGPEANDFVLLKYDDGKYSIKGNNNYMGHDYIFSPNEDTNSFEQCVKWVKENWQQYRNVLFHHVKQPSNNHQNLTESISIKIIDDED